MPNSHQKKKRKLFIGSGRWRLLCGLSSTGCCESELQPDQPSPLWAKQLPGGFGNTRWWSQRADYSTEAGTMCHNYCTALPVALQHCMLYRTCHVAHRKLSLFFFLLFLCTNNSRNLVNRLVIFFFVYCKAVFACNKKNDLPHSVLYCIFKTKQHSVIAFS